MAQQLHVTRSGPADMADNMPAAGLQDYVDATREYKPSYERPDWRVEAVRSAVLLVAVAVAWALWGLWKTSYCWGGRNWQACDSLLWWEPAGALLAVALVVGLPAARVLLWGLAEWRLAQARAARVATTYNRWGDPQRIDVLLPLVEEARRYQLATELKRQTAPWEMYHSVNTFSPSLQAPKEAPALPAPAEESGLVPVDTFLPWLMELHHTMIAGATGSGKTTFARIALGERLRMGYAGLIVDPKGKDWYGLPVVGGGRKFADILATLDGVRLEMDRRFDAYGRGVRDFEPLVVLVDEVPDIMEACRDERRRVVDGRWMRFVKQLGSLAREVQISVILLTQSPLVEDIGMNSAMRKNFTRIALGDEAPALIKEERDAERRRELAALLKGQAFPAALYRRGEVHLLDTASVPQLAERPVRDAQGWQPPAVPLGAQNGHAPALDRAAVQRKAIERAIAQGWTREQARASGLRFDNNLWTRLGGL